jgi:hypothetical protein
VKVRPRSGVSSNCGATAFHPPAGPSLDQPTPAPSGPWLIDRKGLVIDGRDAFLFSLVCVAAKKTPTDPKRVAHAAWAEFTARADLTRPMRDGTRPWALDDARKKAVACCGLASTHTSVRDPRLSAVTMPKAPGPCRRNTPSGS